MKKQVLNEKGMVLLIILLIITIIFGMIDCNNMLLFMATKVISLLLLGICFMMTKYISQRYL